MLQRVITAYRRIARAARKTAAGRTLVPLNILVLEERAAPAGVASVLPLIHPPEAVLAAAAIPAVAIPTPPSVGNGNAANASVRSDLFGTGGAGQPERANELDEMLANNHASKDDAAREAEEHRQVIDVVEQVEDTNAAATVVIEKMVYLPRVDE